MTNGQRDHCARQMAQPNAHCSKFATSTMIRCRHVTTTSQQASTQALQCKVHACEQYTTGSATTRRVADDNNLKVPNRHKSRRNKTASFHTYSSTTRESHRYFSSNCHLMRILLHRAGRNLGSGSLSSSNLRKTLIYVIVLLLLFTTSCNALPTKAENNGFDTSFLATPKPKLTSAQSQPSFITAVHSQEPLKIRAIRGALTPPAKSQKTSPQKRGVDSISNSHHSPQRLVTKVGGFYVEIKRNGKVKGTRRLNAYSVLEFFSVQTGVVAIRGKKSGRYLAMDKKGRLLGLKKYTKACNFHEGLVENNYFIFYQDIAVRTRKRTYRKQLYMGFDKRGRPKRGKKLRRNDSAAHFQKIRAVSTARKRKRPKRPKNRRKRPGGKKQNSRKTKRMRTTA